MKKKVAFVVKYFPKLSETFIVNQINGLFDQGYQVNIYSYERGDSSLIHEHLKHYDLDQQVTYFIKPSRHFIRRCLQFVYWILRHFFVLDWVLFFKTLNVFKHGKVAYSLKLFFESQWFLLNPDIDFIHAHFGMNANRIAYLKACGIIPAEVPLLATFHGYDLMPHRDSFYQTHYAFLLEHAQAFTVNTPYLKGLLEPINIFKKPFHILPVGLGTQYFKPQNGFRKGSNFNLLFCGRLKFWKGADIAIAVVKRLHDIGYENVRLDIIGDGGMRDLLQTQIQDLELQETVFLHGPQKQEVVLEFMQRANAFILPGRYDPETGRAETQGLVIQEAQAVGLPVIVSDVGGMKYGLIDGETGFVIPDGTVMGFVEAVKCLLDDAALCKRMGDAGRDYVVTHYDNQVLTKELLSIYQSL